ncbi:MAG: di-trans,poly-cis-decaprenylcistransferase [Thermoplasmata archaeon]|nr:MAG: di-trans,poly-cis-decaprenylcistransferase [Thermoplasmata archaeon]
MRLVHSDPMPKHIAIIMDGNRRFAIDLGLNPIDGHEYGRDKLEELLEWCLDLQIKILTVYAFSTENIRRKTKEVDRLMELFNDNFIQLANDERVHKHGIRVRVIGQRELLPDEVQEAIQKAEETTKDYDNYHFNLAVAYGGREEIIQAVKDIAQDTLDKKVGIDDINEELVSKYLYTHEIPDPDLILRTSGEERISNFLLWQLAYSELYFSDVYWPGFSKIDFLKAIRSYQLRQRRYGK